MATNQEQTDTDKENAELLAAMLGEGDRAEEPGTLRVRDILHRGDGDLPVPIVVSALRSAGYRFIYDPVTGERSMANNNQIMAQLRKRRPDGSLMFTIHKPPTQPSPPGFKCMLHSEHPNRAYYDTLRFATCRKANLTSLLEVEIHMKHRHGREWATIQREKEEKQKAEDRALQRAILEQAARGALIAGSSEVLAKGAAVVGEEARGKLKRSLEHAS